MALLLCKSSFLVAVESWGSGTRGGGPMRGFALGPRRGTFRTSRFRCWRKVPWALSANMQPKTDRMWTLSSRVVSYRHGEMPLGPSLACYGQGRGFQCHFSWGQQGCRMAKEDPSGTFSKVYWNQSLLFHIKRRIRTKKNQRPNKT